MFIEQKQKNIVCQKGFKGVCVTSEYSSF